MLKRKAYDRILEWKNRPHHNCLLVRGQRQVGKTYIIRKFAEDNYEHIIYTDLSVDERMRGAFETMDVDGIISAMKLIRYTEQFVPGSTVIILDEIQTCPRARSALKLFSMDGRYDVIASGSLLGIRNPELRKKKDTDDVDESLLIPTGYEDHMIMYSLDFEEFLWSRGFPLDSIEEARSCIHERKEMPKVLLDALDRQFRDYMIVGGMPAAVNAFLESNDYSAAGLVVQSILSSCMNDIIQYNLPADSLKVRQCFLSIPSQLSMSNKKFMYSRIPDDGTRGTSERYDPSIVWVGQAGYANFCYNLSNLAHPLSLFEQQRTYKVYMSDTGILNNMLGPESSYAIFNGDTRYNEGAVIENAVAEGIMKLGLPVRFYQCTDNSEGKRMELDFVLEFADDLIAVEVKSGKTRKSPSLEKVHSVFKQVNRRVILSRTNVYVDKNSVEHYPLFACCFINELSPDRDSPKFAPHMVW